MTNFHHFLKMFGYFFIIVVSFENLSHYSKINSFHWLREDIQMIIDKRSREKLTIFMTSALSSSVFLLNFWFLPMFFCHFHSHKTYCDDLLMIHE